MRNPNTSPDYDGWGPGVGPDDEHDRSFEAQDQPKQDLYGKGFDNPEALDDDNDWAEQPETNAQTPSEIIDSENDKDGGIVAESVSSAIDRDVNIDNGAPSEERKDA